MKAEFTNGMIFEKTSSHSRLMQEPQAALFDGPQQLLVFRLRGAGKPKKNHS